MKCPKCNEELVEQQVAWFRSEAPPQAMYLCTCGRMFYEFPLRRLFGLDSLVETELYEQERARNYDPHG